jgi:hypothetical protein
MAQTEDSNILDKCIRFQVYTQFVKTGQAPTIAEVAKAVSCSPSDVQAAYQRLAAGKALVLQKSGAVLMAEPFSTVPTAFAVEVGTRMWWGNCIWDALGIPAMLKQDARLMTACGCCNEAMTLEVRDGKLLNAPGIVHFAIPPREWWQDVVFA